MNALPAASEAVKTDAVTHLEQGDVLVLPHLPFPLADGEKNFLDPGWVDPKTKSVKYASAAKRLWGIAENADAESLAAMLERYHGNAHSLVLALFPHYAARLVTGNTSFRPVEAEGRAQSLRQDDRLLHVDAFPSRPTHGERVLRVFTNVHPSGRARRWRVGERFEHTAKRFLPSARPMLPGEAALLRTLRLTKTRRSEYDHIMLHLHDAMKRDTHYQRECPQTDASFAPGTSWIVYSDQVPHAVTSGQHLLEQTFTLPVTSLARPETAPIRILEHLARRSLA